MQPQINTDFYSQEEILSKKFSKGWFYGFTKTEDYDFLKWTLHDCVFDISDFDFLKLAKSLLLILPSYIFRTTSAKVPSKDYLGNPQFLCEWIYTVCTDSPYEEIRLDYPDNLTVIGNIYENPELLEVK